MAGSGGQLLAVFLLLLATAVPVVTVDCPIVMQINSTETTSQNCPGELTSGQEYQIPSMECALEMIAKSDLFANENRTVCIQLAAGEHTLSYSDRIIYSDIVINGTDAASLTCTDADEESLSQGGYKMFPLHVSGQATVTIQGVSFEGCARPLLFNGSERVTLEDCSFSAFTESAIEIYNTPFVTVSNCSFTNNTSNGISPIRNSGNSGAVSIGFNEDFPDTTSPRIVIQDSNFTRNVAVGSRPCEREITTVLFSKMYVNRGGALGAYFSAPTIESSLTVERCQFIDNRAGDLGGFAYINLSGENDSVTEITFKKCNFSGNNASVLGGGIQITAQTVVSNPILFQDCSFTNNTAGELGGAIKALQFHTQGNLNGLRIENTSFVGNNATVGAALHIQSPFLNVLQYYSTKPSTNRATIKDCSFIENFGKDIIYNDHNHLNFTGNNVFKRNTGSSIRVEGSLLSFNGTLMFESNTAHPEGVSGVLYLSSYAQILLNENVSVSFVNNSGREGAAIVVRYPTVSISFGKTIYNSQCFLQFANHTVPPAEWSNYNVSLEFRGNRADIGPVLYVTSLDACSWFNNSDDYFNTNITETWHFMTARENYVNRNDTLVDIPELYIQTEVQEIQIGTLQPECEAGINADVCAYPGEDIRLNVSALDENKQQTTAFLRIVPNEDSTEFSTEFSPSIVQSSIASDTVNISYSGLGTFDTTTITVEASFSASKPSSDNFTAFHMGCLPGFRLDTESRVCECAVDIREVLSCDPDKQFVLLKDGTWGASPNWSRTLVTHTCPPGYCNCTGSPNESSTEGCALIYSNPALSCNPDRTGVLCGQCKEPYGVGMLTMKCQEFTAKFPMYYWLMPLLIIFITVAVVVIVKAGIAVPSVLLGFLFYIQITAIAVAYIDGHFRLLPAIMNCVHSFLALYVPYDFTLHHGLTALEAYGLKFIPPILVLILAPIVMRIKYKSKSWRGVWTLVLLMYANTVQTSASLLFCPTFTRDTMNGTTESITVWFFDGNVTCYQGVHLALAIVAVIFLVIAGLFIPVSAGIVYQKELRKKFTYFDRHHFEKISKAFTDPYKEAHRWWVPYELVRRYVIIMVLIFWPGFMTLSVSLIGGALIVQWFIQPYKYWWTNLAEAFSVLVLTAVLFLGDTNSFVIHATGTKHFRLFPLLYFPLAVGIVCNYAMISWKIWIGIKKARLWWQMRVTAKALAKKARRQSSIRTTKIYNRMSSQVVSFDDCDEDQDDSSKL